MVDELRKVDRPMRTDVLKYNLVGLNRIIDEASYYDPMSISGEPLYRLHSVIIDECRVFRTKARAPSMLVCIVERVDESVNSIDSKAVACSTDSNGSSPSRPSAGKASKGISCDQEEVGQILGSKYVQTLADLQEHDRKLHEATPAALSPGPSNNSSSSVSTSGRRRDSAMKSNGSLLSSHRKSIPFLSMLGIDVSSAVTNSSGIPDDVLRELSNKLELNTDLSAEAEDDPSDNDTTVSPVVIISAQRLLEAGKIDENEYLQLISSDAKFRGEKVRDDVQRAQLHVESCFGERWEAKKLRYLNDTFSLNDAWPKKDLRCFIVKSNDDLRQEVCCLQVCRLVDWYRLLQYTL